MGKSDADAFDVGGEAAASPDALAKLRKGIQEAIELQAAVETLSNDLAAATARLTVIKTNVIPDLMAEIQSDSFNHAGWSIKLNLIVNGTLPKIELDEDGNPKPETVERRNAAIEYLIENDGEGLLKTDVEMSFGRSQHNEAIDVAERLKSEGHTVTVSSGVHPQTLYKYARDRISEGLPIDTELLGLYTARVATFKPLAKK